MIEKFIYWYPIWTIVTNLRMTSLHLPIGCENNSMVLNVDKCNSITFTTLRSSISFNYTIANKSDRIGCSL